MQKDFDGLTRVDKSIARLKEFEPAGGYYLAFSGGKDSTVLYNLALRAKVKFDAHYSCGGLDPLDLMNFIKAFYSNVIWDKPGVSFWKMFQEKRMPRRNARWCCELIKEHGGEGRTVLTGIRWAESTNRKKRTVQETCCHGNKWFLNPIIDWTEKDVWEYIKTNNLPYCSLYNEGFKRLGCVLCPMKTAKQTQIELQRFPKIATNWRRAFEKLYETHKDKPSFQRWKSSEEMWRWWISRKGERISPEQCRMTLGDN